MFVDHIMFNWLNVAEDNFCSVGDVSLNKFGLEEVEYAALCYSIDVVIHCAAHVNLILPYSALSKVNVTGTHNTVIFCLEKKLKPLHYIW